VNYDEIKKEISEVIEQNPPNSLDKVNSAICGREGTLEYKGDEK
jgi:hypothetical protein